MGDLNTAAYALCSAIRDGAYAEELKLIHNGQPAACPQVIEALRNECPGYETADYQAAIARGMHESMF
ncbi:MAG: hypothetical protein WDM85_01935 [Caulobacteraceae bacterium]